MYDFPAPDLAKITELAFSKVKRSKIIKESLCSLIPYIMPSLAVSSEEVKGKVVAKEVVSILRVIINLSMQVGMVVLRPSSICKVACLATMSREPKVEITSLVTLSNSSNDLAGIVT